MACRYWTTAVFAKLRRTLPFVVAVPLLFCACEQSTVRIDPDDPQLRAFVQLMMPREIEIQKYLTRPVSFAGNGNADGLEIVLAARDAFGDPTKVVGTFHFELFEKRMASSDSLGRRVAFWPVEIDTDDRLLQYWDRLSRFYQFPLQLERSDLPPGQYVLTARLRSVFGTTLHAQYEITREPGPVPAATAGP